MAAPRISLGWLWHRVHDAHSAVWLAGLVAAGVTAAWGLIQNSGLIGAALAGILVGLVVLAIGLLIAHLVQQRRARRDESTATPSSPESDPPRAFREAREAARAMARAATFAFGDEDVLGEWQLELGRAIGPNWAQDVLDEVRASGVLESPGPLARLVDQLTEADVVPTYRMGTFPTPTSGLFDDSDSPDSHETGAEEPHDRPGGRDASAGSAALRSEPKSPGLDIPDRRSQSTTGGIEIRREVSPEQRTGAGAGAPIVVTDDETTEDVTVVNDGSGLAIRGRDQTNLLFVQEQIRHWTDKLEETKQPTHWATQDARVKKIAQRLGQIFGADSLQRDGFRRAVEVNADPMCPHRITKADFPGFNDVQLRAQCFIDALKRILDDLSDEQIQRHFRQWNLDDPSINP